MSLKRQSTLTTTSSLIIRFAHSLLVPKASLFLPPTHLVIIDPSSDLPINVTPNCYQIENVLRYFCQIEKELSLSEDKLVEEFKVSGVIGKFRDVDELCRNRVEAKHQNTGAWILKLVSLEKN